MRIALDATASVGKDLSGVGVYSRELLHGLAAARGGVAEWDWFYRSQRFRKSFGSPLPANVKRRFLADSWGNRSAEIFHGLGQRLPKKRFRKQVATFHDLFVMSAEYSTAEFRERFAGQAREAAAGADLIVAVSQFTANQVHELLGVERERIRVVHHGVTPRVIPALPRENVVLCVGAIQKRKNQARLIRAFRGMPEGWKLVLAGSQGFDAPEAIEAARQNADVLVTGYVSDADLAGWYARARMFAFPSLDEGFGMPVLEAMAAGIPVVAGNRSALPEVCGDAALLVDPENEDELAAALVKLANDDALRDEMTQRGVARAAEFTWEKAVRKTLGIYIELTDELLPMSS